MSEVTEIIRRALGVPAPGGTSAAKQRKTSFETAGRSTGISEPEAPEPDLHPTIHDDHDTLSDIELEGYEDYSARLANSITEDELSEDDLSEDDLSQVDTKDNTSARVSTTRLKQSSFSPVRSLSPRPVVTKSTSRNKPSPTIKSTTFLPSLTLGGYWSNSDSVGSDADSQAANINVRKNRMGQQARRQLWEKKFGHKASHIKKQGRDQGWDLRKGAQGGDERGSRVRGRGGKSNIASGSRQRRPVQGASGANSDPIGVRRDRAGKADKLDEPLHPSWLAAKKMKEGKKATVFAGKKIVFE